jgi:hypothetical protein
MDTSTTEQQATPQASQEVPQTEYFEEYPHLTEAEVEETFLNAVAEIPTQPLVRPKTPQEQVAERQVCLLLAVFVLSFLAGTALALFTYPTVTVVITPISKRVTYTTRLAIPIRSLAPVTLTKTGTAPTTGTGHQAATRASGTLTFYNGQATPQTVASGTVFTANDGVQVVTGETVTVPAAAPPYLGQTTATAQAATPGSAGNIPALAINLSDSLFVKNLTAFTGGRDVRTYRAVARADIETLTETLKTALAAQLPQAFALTSGEALLLTHCAFRASPNHRVGEEAATITIKASQTCAAVAYHQRDLQQRATAVFTHQTRPDAHFRLVGEVSAVITSVSPLTVRMEGLWVYTLSQDEQAYLASQIAGDTAAQARTYLLHTGVLIQVTIAQQLPRDPSHIKFVQVIAI